MAVKLINRMKKILRLLKSMPNDIDALQASIDETKLLIAQGLINSIKKKGKCELIEEVEFKVFSQFGDDGIIQYLIHQTGKKCCKFIEFGVGDYRESNTRFLLSNNNWDGLIIEGDPNKIKHIKEDRIFWRHNLTMVQAFVNCENINTIFKRNKYTGEIGLLSIDIDGNDYWIWKAIKVVNPILVVVEYNALFGKERAVSIPYDPIFNRYNAHYSGLFWGASLKAFCLLAVEKGYEFVGCNSNGNNAYFARKDCLGQISVHTVETGFRPAKWRDSRDKKGQLDFLSPEEKLEQIKNLEVFDVQSEENIRICELDIDLAI